MTAPADILVPTLTQGHTLDWSPGTTYQPNMDVIDRGGLWRCVVENKGSQPISGNANWDWVGGAAYVDSLLDPVALSTAPFYDPAQSGPGVLVIPAPGAGLAVVLTGAVTEWTSAGDVWGTSVAIRFSYGDTTEPQKINQAGSANLDDSGGFQVTVTDVAGMTDPAGLFVNLPVVMFTKNDATSGGTVFGTRSVSVRTYYRIQRAPDFSTFFLISAVDQGTKTFTVNGDASALVAGQLISVVGSTGNNRGYTVVSATFTPFTTDIIVSQAIADATADGWVKVV